MAIVNKFGTLMSTGSGGSTVNTDSIHGYLGILSGFYFGESTGTIITIGDEDVDTWIDAPLTVYDEGNNEGLFDYRPSDLITAQPVGYDVGTNTYNLEGLTLKSFCGFRAGFTFNPDIDEGQLEARMIFQRHSGSIPSDDFPIETTALTMSRGADFEYLAEPYLTFFVGDTIDTNAVGDAGTFRFQIKTDVAGTLDMREQTLFIYK